MIIKSLNNMSEITSYYIKNILTKSFISNEYIELKLAIIKSLKENIPEYSEEKIADLAEEKENEVESLLKQYLVELVSMGIVPDYEITEDKYFIRKQSNETVVIDQLIGLSSSGFEEFCSC